MLVAIDAGHTMRARAPDGSVPLIVALRAACDLLEGKLVGAPYDHVGIVLWNTAASHMETESKSGFHAHMIEYRRIRQVDVPDTYILEELIRAAEADLGVLDDAYAPAARQMPIEHVLVNALHLLTTASRGGTRRMFFMTNQDDPFPEAREREQRACIAVVKDFYRRGVDLEPFFMSTAARPFALNAFYADIVGEYDDGVVDDAMRPWRLRVLQDQNMSKRYAWDAAPKFAELAEHADGRAGAKTAVFELDIDMGEVDAGSHWYISVKGYSLVSERHRDVPLRVSSYGREDPADLDEIVARQETVGHDGHVLSAEDVQLAFLVGGVCVPVTPDELRDARAGGRVPGITLVGFVDADLSLRNNIKHAYFLYPSDLRHAGSKRTFSALLNSMLAKRRYALGVYMPRNGVVPHYVAIMPQAEVVDDDGSQLVPPGMNMVPLPYADDMREVPPPPAGKVDDVASDEAAAIVRAYTRKEPFNPDVYANPSLRYHYGVLKAAAFGRPAPAYTDTVVPEYATIAERAGAQIAAWNRAIAQHAQSNHVQIAGPAQRVPRDAPLFTEADAAEVRARHADGSLGRLTVGDLREACAYFGLSRQGRKGDLLAVLGAFLSS